jgi:hypothetical protein
MSWFEAMRTAPAVAEGRRTDRSHQAQLAEMARPHHPSARSSLTVIGAAALRRERMKQDLSDIHGNCTLRHRL